ncbi:MAG TPA: hypothetical protein VGV09_11465 [Steroidobacteraceae bacterium]|nr:hypothetical protein [Steroidobacteraceae bacterium]
MRRAAWSALWVAAVIAAGVARAAPDPGPGAAQNLDPNLVRKLTPGQSACLGDGTGFVRARIRGALNLDLSWKDAQLACSGDARPDGSGLRVSFAGPGPGGKVLRLVFGISAAHEGKPGREKPTNLTVLLDGGRIFATQGDDKCTTDQLSQRPLPTVRGLRAWRIQARGFCVTPANALDGKGRILVSRFDFAGRVEFSGRG